MVAVPNVFTPGTTISSSAVNANFAAVANGTGAIQTLMSDSGSANPVASPAQFSITSLALPAGDWDLSGQFSAHVSTLASQPNYIEASVWFATDAAGNDALPYSTGAAGNISASTTDQYTAAPTPLFRYQVATTTTVYLICSVSAANPATAVPITISGVTAQGRIVARQMH